MTTTAPKPPRASTAPSLTPSERDRLERAFSIPRARFLLGIPVAAASAVLWSVAGAHFNFYKLGDGATRGLELRPNQLKTCPRLAPTPAQRRARTSAFLVENSSSLRIPSSRNDASCLRCAAKADGAGSAGGRRFTFPRGSRRQLVLKQNRDLREHLLGKGWGSGHLWSRHRFTYLRCHLLGLEHEFAVHEEPLGQFQ